MAGIVKLRLTVPRGLFVGMDNYVFKAPVHPYDRIRVEGELLEKRVTSKGDRVVVKYSWLAKNQKDIIIAQGQNTSTHPNPDKN